MGMKTAERCVSDAWSEYLRTCRAAGDLRYDEIEPWAWRRLQQRLRLIARSDRRAKETVAA